MGGLPYAADVGRLESAGVCVCVCVCAKLAHTGRVAQVVPA
jgi:hypothetical protein